MGSKMLIDATHSEETRVVVCRGQRIEEFDFESAARKQLKGNIYLAKVTRVEPSLQAAFVDYGGNRHGFLAFAEIHPDYYQIPVADRQALLREQEEDDRLRAQEEDDEDEAPSQSDSAHGDAGGDQAEHAEAHEEGGNEASAGDGGAENGNGENGDAVPADAPHAEHGLPAAIGDGVETVSEDAQSRKVESVGAEDAMEEVPVRRQRRAPRRTYKIQEVIKRRQVILIQVVKEERGNKGAALTTYLSLAGRYCVLMPNTARGGGISRKITDSGDRRRLKEVAREVEVPDGMGLIVRTAGAQRTKTEIKRDYDYLIRLWENVRDLTLQSQAPALVYEEGSLIKRAIRDLYTKDVEEVQVEGEEAYREAKEFMKMLMPSHARNVKLYKDARTLFSRNQIETQLDGLFSPQVTLPSGGYIVMNQTEALVSIDINSGKSTREHNIEDTALRTNMEASDEIARQLRLRDLAGLIVIDYIDMEEKRNNRAVERRLKEALKNDRARIQVGHISHFGLMEMSRQRLRPGLLEGSTKTCPHCEGRGIIRSVSSCALSVLRSIEEHLVKKPESLTVHALRDVAFYILNDKRDHLLSIEANFGVSVFISPSDTVKASQAVIEKAGERAVAVRKHLAPPVKPESAFEEADDDIPADEPEEEIVEAREPSEEESAERGERHGRNRPPREARDGEGNGRRRGRRGGRRGRGGERDNRGPRAEGGEDAPGLGEQPGMAVVSEGEDAPWENGAEASPETVESGETRAEGAADGETRGDSPRGEGRGRRRGRDRFGRNRDRNGGGGRENGGGPRREPREERGADDEPRIVEARPVEEFRPTPPPPPPPPAAQKAEEPPRPKWAPPAPTITAAPEKAKSGWWSKRGA
jgi:ribonuclease E